MIALPMVLGDDAELEVTLIASVTNTVRVNLRVGHLDSKGRLEIERAPVRLDVAHSAGDRTEEFTYFKLPYEILVAAHFSIDPSVKRGQAFVKGLVRQRGTSTFPFLQGYVYNGHGPSDGENVEPGPGGGEGFLSWVQVFHNRAGNAAALDFDLFLTNTLRKVYGVAWYYHCDGNAATRTHPRPKLLGLGGVKPTGFTLTGNNALYDELGQGDNSLVLNEEGVHFTLGQGGDGRKVSVDNGAVSVASATLAPSPFPLLVTEVDTDTILRFPAVTNGLAGDTHSAYVLIEEWLVI